MNPKSYLRQIRDISLEIESKQKEKEVYHQEMLSLPATDYSQERVQSSSNNPLESAVLKYIELTKDIDEQIERLSEVRSRISKEIDQVDDVDARHLLRLRYIKYYTWEKIAVEMHYNISWIYKLHSRALQKFKEDREREGQPVI